jgi:hypothetical protein
MAIAESVVTVFTHVEVFLGFHISACNNFLDPGFALTFDLPHQGQGDSIQKASRGASIQIRF